MIVLPTERQLEVLYIPSEERVLLSREPEWLIIVGLGDGTEAQLAREKWPSIKIVGVDPDPIAIDYQLQHGWRGEDRLVEAALSDTCGSASMHCAGIGTSTLHPRMVERARLSGGHVVEVDTMTLDNLNARYGPFSNAVLWIDAEGHDHKVLLGARGLLGGGNLLAVTVEVWTSRPDLLKENGEMRWLLEQHGFRMVEIFGCEWWGHNEVFVREDLL